MVLPSNAVCLIAAAAATFAMASAHTIRLDDGITRPNKYILYLQPVAGYNPLWSSVSQFFEKSRVVGVNEAQMYHPHCSAVGFFSLDPQQPALLSTIVAAISRIFPKDATIAVDKSRGIELTDRQLQIGISTCGFCEFAKALKEELVDYDIHIRLKPLDHMSLAYLSNRCIAPDAHERMMEFDPTLYAELARSTLDLDADNGIWELVLYEQTFQSASFQLKHEFRRIASWNASGCTTLEPRGHVSSPQI